MQLYFKICIIREKEIFKLIYCKMFVHIKNDLLLFLFLSIYFFSFNHLVKQKFEFNPNNRNIFSCNNNGIKCREDNVRHDPLLRDWAEMSWDWERWKLLKRTRCKGFKKRSAAVTKQYRPIMLFTAFMSLIYTTMTVISIATSGQIKITKVLTRLRRSRNSF